MTERADTVLAGGRVLDATGALLDADLHLRDGLVDAIVPRDRGTPGDGAGPGPTTVDCRGRWLLPGLVAAHTHSASQLGRTAIADDRLEPWLPVTQAESATLDGAAAAVAARLGVLDAWRHGATTTLDHAALLDGHAAAVVDAYRDAGARVTLAVQVSDRTLAASLDGASPAARAELATADRRPAVRTADALARCREVVNHARGTGGLTVALGPSAPERCSDALLAGIAAMGRDEDLPFHVHLLESDLQRRGGDPVGRLVDHGLLGARTSVAHACHVDGHDVERLAAADAAVVHNPLSNLLLGSGRLDVRALLDAGVRVGLGCDGWNCGGAQDVLGAARLAIANRRPDTDPATWLHPAEGWALATVGGAAALGAPPGVGVLRAGARADVLVVDPVRAGWLPEDDPVAQAVLGGLAQGLRRVFVAGAEVLRDGEPTTIDAERLHHDAARVRRHVVATARHADAARLRPLVRAATDPSPTPAR